MNTSRIIRKNMNVGYYFAVVHPDTGKYVYVGLSRRPWEYIFRMISAKSICIGFYEWMQGLFEKYPLGVEILGPIVADRYWAQVTGEPVPPLPENHPYKIRLEWVILGHQEEESNEEGRINVSTPGQKSRLIRKLKAEGHPIFTQVAGRKRKHES